MEWIPVAEMRVGCGCGFCVVGTVGWVFGENWADRYDNRMWLVTIHLSIGNDKVNRMGMEGGANMIVGVGFGCGVVRGLQLAGGNLFLRYGCVDDVSYGAAVGCCNQLLILGLS